MILDVDETIGRIQLALNQVAGAELPLVRGYAAAKARAVTQYADLIADQDPAACYLIATDNAQVWALVRRREGRDAIGIIFNLDWENAQSFSVQLPTGRSRTRDLLRDEEITLEEGRLQAELPPSHCTIVAL